MSGLSKHARFVLDRMEGDRCYEVRDLRAVVPDAGAEGVREIMHELWINRQVERVGDSGWRRHRSAPRHEGPIDAPAQAPSVKPEDLFDHETFQDFFR